MQPTIAIVDDDRNILTSIEIALKAEGFNTRTYTDGESALQALTREPADVAVLDIKMPRMDGLELLTRLSRLAEGTGIAIEGVYRLDLSVQTKKANAMLAGLGRTRRVLLGDTMLQRFSHDEIEVVMAHELGHHVHRHIPKMLLLGGLLSIVGLWLCDLSIFWLHPELTRSQLPVYIMPLVILMLSIFGLVVGPLNAAISRHFERQCDRYALRRTGNPEAFISAFQKLAQGNNAAPAPPWLEVLLFHSHPPISKRLAMAEACLRAS